jgi:hypothetical protein
MIHSLRGRVVAAVSVAAVTLATYVALVFALFEENLQKAVDDKLVSYGNSVAAAVRAGGPLPEPPFNYGDVAAIVFDPEA